MELRGDCIGGSPVVASDGTAYVGSCADTFVQTYGLTAFFPNLTVKWVYPRDNSQVACSTPVCVVPRAGVCSARFLACCPLVRLPASA